MQDGARLNSSEVRPLPGWITPAVVADTRATFGPLYGRPLADDEVTDILLNVGNLFRVLTTPSATQARTRQPNHIPVSPPGAEGARCHRAARRDQTIKEATNG